MSAEHLRCCGRLIVPNQDTSHLATLSLVEGMVVLESALGQEHLSLSDLQFDGAGSSLLRRISLADGRILETPDSERVDRLASRANRHALRQSWGRTNPGPPWRSLALAALLVVCVIGFGIVTLPTAMGWMADSVVEMIGPDSEAIIGRIALAEADTALLQPSWLDHAQQEPAHRVFDSLVQIAALNDRTPRLVLRHGGRKLGANALALPGGTVVMTDELFTLLSDDDDALAGVLAHELGHIDQRHGLRLFFRSSLPEMAEYWLHRDDQTLGVRVSGLVESLAANAHGRRFELEADAYSLMLLRRAGRSPDGMIRALTKLSLSAQESNSWSMQYLHNHPSTSERMSHLQSLAARTEGR